MLLALLCGLALLIAESRRRHWPKEEVVPIALGAFVGGMIGARAAMFFFIGWEAAPYLLNMATLFDPRVGPGSIVGGVWGGYIGGYIAAKIIGKAGCTCDAFAPAIALASAIGRVGCFMAADDGLGKATGLSWGVHAPGVDYLVHPTPLYDMGFNLIWFAVLMLLRDHPRMQGGNLLKLGLAGYALFRFLVEFVRTTPVLAFGLTGPQLLCGGLILLMALYYVRQLRGMASVRAA